MHPAHRAVAEQLADGGTLVEEVRQGRAVRYYIRQGLTETPVSERVYFRMRELAIIEADRQQFFSSGNVDHTNKLSAPYASQFREQRARETHV